MTKENQSKEGMLVHVVGVVGEESARKWRDGAVDNEGQDQIETI